MSFVRAFHEISALAGIALSLLAPQVFAADAGSLAAPVPAAVPAPVPAKGALERESQLNLQRLLANREHLIGVELIVAAGSDSKIYSRFGHTLLRFVDDNTRWNSHLTLGFLAEVDESDISVSKGIRGGYPVMASLTTLEETWVRYIQGEQRPLERHILPLTRAQLDRLVDTLAAWTADPAALGSYKFFTRNCASVMAEFLSAAGLGSSDDRPLIPTHFSGWLERSWLAPFPKLLVRNPFGMLSRAAKLLGLSTQELQSGRGWPADAAERLLAGLDEKELKQLYRAVPAMPFVVSIRIAARVNYSSGSSYDQVMEMLPVPPVLYGICGDDACFAELAQAARAIWPGRALEESADSIRFWLANTDLAFGPEKKPARARTPFPSEERTEQPFNLLVFPSAEDGARQQAYLERLARIAGQE